MKKEDYIPHQDYQGREIDAVIELTDGRWCAFEIKLDANQIDAAAAQLLNFRKNLPKIPKAIRRMCCA